MSLAKSDEVQSVSSRSARDNESSRLQKEAERFTAKLEQERRKSLVLDENIKSAKKLLRQKQLALKDTISLQKVNNRELDRITELEKQLNSLHTQVGDLCSTNTRLRIRVDNLRKGNLDSQSFSKQVNQAIGDTHVNVERVSSLHSRSVRKESKMRQRMLSLHSSYEAEQMNSTSRIAFLEQEIREDRKRKKELMKKLSSSIAAGTSELSESGQVTKHLYEKWVQMAKDTRKEFDQYVRYVSDLKVGLEHMKETAGLDDYKQVVLSLLNSLERQREIQNHLIYLTEQVESIEKELKGSKEYIQAVHSKEEKNAAVFVSKETLVQGKIRAIEEASGRKREMLQSLKDAVSSLRVPVSDLRNLCFSVDITTDIGNRELPFDESDFNLNSAGLYLLQLEEMMSKLAVLLKRQRGGTTEGNFEFAFLTEKRFDQSMNISSLLEDEALLVDSEESHPLTTSEFRLRAEKVLGRVTL